MSSCLELGCSEPGFQAVADLLAAGGEGGAHQVRKEVKIPVSGSVAPGMTLSLTMAESTFGLGRKASGSHFKQSFRTATGLHHDAEAAVFGACRHGRKACPRLPSAA